MQSDVETTKNAAKFATFARNQLRKHGLDNYSFTFIKSRGNIGYAEYDRKEVGISIYLLDYDEAAAKETLKHEIAHAMAYEETGDTGHNSEAFKAACKRIGADPAAFMQDEKYRKHNATWIGTCGKCGAKYYFYAKPGKKLYCTRCANRKSLVLSENRKKADVCTSCYLSANKE